MSDSCSLRNTGKSERKPGFSAPHRQPQEPQKMPLKTVFSASDRKPEFYRIWPRPTTTTDRKTTSENPAKTRLFNRFQGRHDGLILPRQNKSKSIVFFHPGSASGAACCRPDAPGTACFAKPFSPCERFKFLTPKQFHQQLVLLSGGSIDGPRPLFLSGSFQDLRLPWLALRQ